MDKSTTITFGLLLSSLVMLVLMSFLNLNIFPAAMAQGYDNIQQNSITENRPFNIAVAGDWGCKKDAEKTVENIQDKNPELVIANGDLSYDESSQCWFEIIQPLKSKMTIAMGDHDYSDTSGGITGIIDQIS